VFAKTYHAFLLLFGLQSGLKLWDSLKNEKKIDIMLHLCYSEKAFKNKLLE